MYDQETLQGAAFSVSLPISQPVQTEYMYTVHLMA